MIRQINSSCVVIPIYKARLDGDELTSLKQAGKIFHNYEIFLVCPESLHISEYLHLLPKAQIARFDDNFFESIAGYNNLLLDTNFYRRFVQFSHMLIYQLDAYVFSDRLQDWSKRGYSYIGAPWYEYELSQLRSIRAIVPVSHKYPFLKWVRKLQGREYLVGNGGFSLRHIPIFMEICEEVSRIPALKLVVGKYNEDNFWSFIAPRIRADFIIPDWRTALSFAFEMNPGKAFEINDFTLPFGCHAWRKHDTNGFWMNVIGGNSGS